MSLSLHDDYEDAGTLEPVSRSLPNLLLILSNF